MKALIVIRYGAGFSQWNDPNLAVDQRVIKTFEENPEMDIDEFKSMCESFGYDDVHILPEDFEWLRVAEVPENVYFRIIAYDGCETLEVLDLDEWFHS